MKLITAAVTAMALTASASGAFAACDEGEIVIKLSHVTNTDKHPKGIAATLLQSRVNDEMNGKACLEYVSAIQGVYPGRSAGRSPRTVIGKNIRRYY